MNGAAGGPERAVGVGRSQPAPRRGRLSQPPSSRPPGKREGPKAVPLCEGRRRAGEQLPARGGLAGGRSALGARVDAG